MMLMRGAWQTLLLAMLLWITMRTMKISSGLWQQQHCTN